MKKTAKPKTMTLEAFMKLHGPTNAASLLGVTVVTLWRWKNNLTSPKGNDARRLDELGVTIA